MFTDSNKQKFLALEPFIVKQALPKMLDWHGLENLLNCRPLMRFSRFGYSSELPEIQLPVPSWSKDPETWPITALTSHVLNHQTIFLTDMSRITKEVNETCAELEKIFECPVDMHLFLSLVIRHKGLGIHKDKNHNIIAPQEGEIEVAIYDSNGLLYEDVLTSGDFAFVPAGVFHKIESNTKRFSFSFPVDNSTAPEGMKVLPECFEDRNWIHLEV